MDINSLLQVMLHGNQLKRTIRTGWAMRGVAQPENVAAHSFGVAYIVLILSDVIDHPFNLESLLTMALLHDLPESLTTDIPTPAWRFLPEGSKQIAEREAMMSMVGQTVFETRFMTAWEQLRRNDTPEAHLVHDADKLDQFLQAYVYEQQTGNRQLQEFWAKQHQFHYSPAQAIYEELRHLRHRDFLTGE